MAAVVPMRGGGEAAAAARVPAGARQMGSCTSRKTASFLPRTRRNASTAASAAATAGSPSSSTALSSSSSSLGGDKVVIKTARTGWAFAGKEKGKRRGGVGGTGGILGGGTGKGTGSVKGFALKVNSVLADVPKELLEQALQVPAIFPRTAADPKTVASIILGGGAGTRLFPLTMRRAKPAVPIGGCYRLIDVPMSNCINSGINKVYILTQFNSQSLNRHIARTYNVSSGVNFGDGFIEVLAAMQTSGEFGNRWFQGTADAVRQFSWLFEDPKLSQIENILILSGDHLYRMDYIDFLQKHLDSGADVSVSCIPVDDSRASDFGLMKIDKMGRIVQFHEKPKGDSLKAMQVDTTVLGLGHLEAKKFPYIASMGIYLFRTDVLLNLLRHRYPSANDFGSEIIPLAAKEFDVQAYLFNGYWEDIGTIKSFYDANLALTDQPPKFEFYDPLKPIYTSPRFLPPTKYEGCQVSRSIISHGCFLQKCVIDHSVIGLRSRLDYGVEIKDTMMMGADYYQTEAEIASFLAEGRVPIGVGKNTKIRNCIIDKNAKIGQNVIIANSENVEEAERASEGFYIRSGITVVLKNATIPDGTII